MAPDSDKPWILRLLTAAGGGILVTTALLYLMQLLVATGEDVAAETRNFEFCWCLPPRRPVPVETEQPKPVRPPEPLPVPLIRTDPDTPDNIEMELQLEPIVPDARYDVTVLDVFTDNPVTMIHRASAAYPLRALEQGIEGFVIVEYNVSIAGTVRDVRIVESSDNVFDDAAISAVTKFRYKPRMVSGIAQQTTGLQRMFKFEIQNDQRP